MATPRHLGGVTVLDLSSVGPAARCSRILADYGAEVIKVGPPPRKGSVQIQPPYHSYSAGRGMKRVQVDLKSPRGLAAFLRLAESADVLIESFRPGVAERIGVGYEALRRANPRLVYCSTSGYGQDGPYASWAGHDLNYLGLGGFLHCSGRRSDGGPTIPGATVADSAAGGMHAAVAILAALIRRTATGVGEHLDVCVAEGVLQLMSLHVDQYLATGEEPGPGSSILTGRYACYDLYAARDGKWLAVGAIEPAFFENLCRALELEQWIPHQLDDDRQDEIRAALRSAFARRDRDAWIDALSGRDTCVSPVLSISELTENEHFRERHAFVEAEDEEHGRFRQVGPVLAGGDRTQDHYPLGDRTATDTAALLLRAGLAESEVEKMRSEGVVA